MNHYFFKKKNKGLYIYIFFNVFLSPGNACLNTFIVAMTADRICWIRSGCCLLYIQNKIYFLGLNLCNLKEIRFITAPPTIPFATHKNQKTMVYRKTSYLMCHFPLTFCQTPQKNHIADDIQNVTTLVSPTNELTTVCKEFEMYLVLSCIKSTGCCYSFRSPLISMTPCA